MAATETNTDTNIDTNANASDGGDDPNDGNVMHATIEPMEMSLVVAVTPELGIGKDGTLPWAAQGTHLPGDLRYFRQMTSRTEDPAKQVLIRTSQHKTPTQRDATVFVAKNARAWLGCALVWYSRPHITPPARPTDLPLGITPDHHLVTHHTSPHRHDTPPPLPPHHHAVLYIRSTTRTPC